MNNAQEPINPTSTINEPYLKKELQTTTTHIGLTKREHYAGLAMQALISSCDWSISPFNDFLVGSTSEKAIQLADELLKQLETK